MATTPVRANPPKVAIWLPRVSQKPNRARIRMPFHPHNGAWLVQVCGPGTQPRQERPSGTWTVARTHFDAVATALAERFGSVAILQDYDQAIYCTAACQFAESDPTLCNCSCTGLRHGQRGATATVADWTDGQLYVYHNFTRRCWIRTNPTLPDTVSSTQRQVTFDELMRMLANVNENPKQWRRHVHVTPINHPTSLAATA